MTNTLVSLKSWMYDGAIYWVNPAHILMVSSEQEGFTRMKLTNGEVLYLVESPEEIADMIKRASK